MISEASQSNAHLKHLGKPFLAGSALVVTLLVSNLPDILLTELTGLPTSWLLWAKVALLAGLVIFTFVWKEIQPLRQFFFIFVALYLAEWFFGWIGGARQWQAWFSSPAFTKDMFGSQLLRLGVALTMVAVLWIVKRRRSDFFLVKGQTDAVAEPVRWLGMDRPVTWARFGWILSLCISLGTLTFLVITGRPSPGTLVKVIPMLPAVLLFAALNAFSEELNYRASFLATLPPAITRGQALLITASFFGIGHFYGVPYGVIGVVLAGFLGWILGKSMLETKGFFWPWFIHFLQDVAIFIFIAAGSVVAGGR